MHKNKSAIALVVAITVFIFCYLVTKPKANDYYDHATSLDLIKVIDSPDLTMEMLAARNGKLIIERAVGIVKDAETGEGYILGYPEFYISYANVDGISNGNVICSYFVYNPDNNYEDDILMRFDYIIDKGKVD
jgi:hypothetical protein